MSFDEKFTWVNAIVTLVVAGVYAFFVVGQIGSTPVDQIPYQVPMLTAIIMSIVAIIIGAIVTAILSSIAVEITGQGSHDDVGKSDERDKDIGRRGELAGYYVVVAGAVAALALAMLRQDQFWIANALYFSFAVGTIVASGRKLMLYRGGF